MILPAETIAILAAVAFCAGFLDAIAGGGGLLTVPALLATGLPPITCLAANKLQSACGTAMACFTFGRAGHIAWRRALLPAVGAALGAAAGAMLVRRIDPHVIAGVIPLLLIATAGYFILSPRMSDVQRQHRLNPGAFALVAAIIGFYDGFFGPGAGAFYMLGMVTLLGLGAVNATGHTKLLNLVSNLASLSLFAIGGHVPWMLAGAMAIGNVAGATLGSRAAMRWGSRLIKPLLVTVSLAMTIKLIADPANPLHRWLLGQASALAGSSRLPSP